MKKMPRREFIQQTALGGTAATILAANVIKLQAKPLGLPIGCQVWPHRASLNDLPAFLTRMSGIGVTRLELCSPIGYGSQFALAQQRQVK